MKKLSVFLKGILLGFVGLAIPGLSASTIAIEVGIYYALISSLSELFKDFKKNALFLLILVIGYFTGGFIGAFTISFLYVKYPLIIILCVIGFVLGGIGPMTLELKDGLKRPSCWLTMIVVMLLLIGFSFFLTEGKPITFDDMKIYDYIILFIIGIITSSTLVVPGVDFAILLLSLGYYYALVSIIADIFSLSHILHNLIILGVYLLGYGIGAFLFSKLIHKTIDRFMIQTKYANFAFVIIAPVIVIKKGIVDNPNFVYNNIEAVVGSALFVVSFIIMLLILRYFKNKEKKEEIEENA